MRLEPLHPPWTAPPTHRPPGALRTHAALTGYLGAASFGVAMASLAPSPTPGTFAGWVALLPALLLATWLTCLPALYIPWAGRDPAVRLRAVLQASFEGLATLGTCLGATAPILWFFAVTAPDSGTARLLGPVFAFCAFLGGAKGFERGLTARGLTLPSWAQVCFLGLFTLTFLQFGEGAGLSRLGR